MSNFSDVLRNRIASRHFSPDYVVPDDDLRSLLEDCAQAPSSFNLQHWRFVVITNPDLKIRLLSTTLPTNRERVMEASINVLIFGDLQAHLGLKDILEECVTAGTLSRAIANEWLAFATQAYTDLPQLARDEAIRSCSLTAMTLMLSAANRGLASCPIGFNAPELIKVLEVSDRYVPVIWIALGKLDFAEHQRRPRRAIDELLSYDVAPA